MSNKTQNAKKAKTGSAHSRSALKIFIPIILFGLLSLEAMPSGGRLATGKVCDKGACVNAERATTSYQWEKGLSGRSGLDQKSGMIFIFDKPDYRCMWMKGMKFNLDILWLDNNGRITKVVRNISPATYPVSFCGQNTRYVVEVNSGEARSLGWDIGDSLQL